MTATISLDPTTAAQAWLEKFERALGKDADLTPLFAAPSYSRDAVAFSGTLLTYTGDAIVSAMLAAQPTIKATLSDSHTPCAWSSATT